MESDSKTFADRAIEEQERDSAQRDQQKNKNPLVEESLRSDPQVMKARIKELERQNENLTELAQKGGAITVRPDRDLLRESHAHLTQNDPAIFGDGFQSQTGASFRSANIKRVIEHFADGKNHTEILILLLTAGFTDRKALEYLRTAEKIILGAAKKLVKQSTQ